MARVISIPGALLVVVAGLALGREARAQTAVRVTSEELSVRGIEKHGGDVWFATDTGFHRLRPETARAEVVSDIGTSYCPACYVMLRAGSSLFLRGTSGVFVVSPEHPGPIQLVAQKQASNAPPPPKSPLPDSNEPVSQTHTPEFEVVACDGEVWVSSRDALYHVQEHRAVQVRLPPANAPYGSWLVFKECPQKIGNLFWTRRLYIDHEHQAHSIGPERQAFGPDRGPGEQAWWFMEDRIERHDGSKVTTLKLPAKIVTVETVDEVAWIWTVDGLYRHRLSDAKPIKVLAGDFSGARGATHRIDDNGALFTDRRRLYALKGGTVEFLAEVGKENESSKLTAVGGHIWLSTGHGLFRVDGDTIVPILKKGVATNAIWHNPIDNRFWLVSYDGQAYRVDGNTAVEVWNAEVGLQQAASSSESTHCRLGGMFAADLSRLAKWHWISKPTSRNDLGVTACTAAPLVAKLLQLGETVYWVIMPHATESKTRPGTTLIRMHTVQEFDGQMWLGTKDGGFRIDPDLEIALELRSPLTEGVWETGDWPVDIAYVRAGKRVEFKDEQPAFFVWEEDTPPEQFTTTEFYRFSVPIGQFDRTLLVRDTWHNIHRVRVTGKGDVRPVRLSPAVMLGGLGAVWALFVGLAVAFAPFSGFLQRRLMSRGFRSFGSLGLVPLALEASPGLRRHLLRRYLRAIRADVDFASAKQRYVVPDEELAPERFGAALETHRRILLAGPSGIGKTSYFRYLTMICASADRELPLRGMIPVFMPIGRYPGEDPEAIFHAQLRNYGLITDRALTHRLLHHGGFALFIDGLNEVDEDARVRVNQFVDRHWATNWICVSTQEVYPLFSWMHRVQVAALDRERVAEILRRRLGESSGNALCERFTDDTYDICRIPQDLEYVIDLVRRSEGLPRSRHDLYTKVLAPVLRSWQDQGRGDQTELLFQRAYEMLRDRAPWMQRDDDPVPSALRDEMVRHKFLVKLEGEAARYHFRHDLLRAYLAARWFAPRWRELLRRDRTAVDANWRAMLEFTILDLDSAEETRAIIDALLARNHRVARDVFNWAERFHVRLTAGWAADFKRRYGEELLRQAANADNALGKSTMLTGQQYEQLTKALLDAFPGLPRLTQMVRFKLGKNLAEISIATDLRTIVFDLIGAAEADGWTPRLIAAARESSPGNAALLVFAQQLGLAPAAPPTEKLEKLIKKANAMVNVAEWRTRLGEIEGRVCRIEIPMAGYTAYGTGFLVGPDVLLTNHHVIAPLLRGAARPEDVILRFDYKRLADGTTLSQGKEYRLAADTWLLDSSEPSPIDLEDEPKSGAPAPEHLDHALLRVAGTPGNDAVGAGSDPGGAARGWIEVSTPQPALVPGAPLLIMQHPSGDPLKLAVDEMIGPNSNATRVRYKTNTLPGSSGSPCFDIQWRLVALHHSGDPAFVAPAYNEGIPLAALLALLEQRGKRGLLGAHER